MKNKLYISIFLFLFSMLGYAQSNYYYYYNNNKVFLNLDRTSLTLITENDFLKSSVSSLSGADASIAQTASLNKMLLESIKEGFSYDNQQ